MNKSNFQGLKNPYVKSQCVVFSVYPGYIILKLLLCIQAYKAQIHELSSTLSSTVRNIFGHKKNKARHTDSYSVRRNISWFTISSHTPTGTYIVNSVKLPTLKNLSHDRLGRQTLSFMAVFVIHHFSGIGIWNWNGYRRSRGLKYGMWNAKIFSVDWIAEWDFIFPIGGLWNGNNNPKIHSVVELDF